MAENYNVPSATLPGAAMVGMGSALGVVGVAKIARKARPGRQLAGLNRSGFALGALGVGAVAGASSLIAQRTAKDAGLSPTQARVVGASAAALATGAGLLVGRRFVGGDRLGAFLGLGAAAGATASLATGLLSPVTEAATPSKITYSTGSRAEMLVDTPETFKAISEAIDGATDVVNVTMFSLLHTGTGRELVDLLIKKAGEGVEVNLQVDATGSYQIPGHPGWRMLEEAEAKGVNVVRNLPNNPVTDDAVDHRKLYVIDGKVAFTGGMNVGGKYDTWHDTMVRLDGPAVDDAERLFAERWKATGGSISPRQQRLLDTKVPAAGGDRIALVQNSPGRDIAMTQHFLDLVNGAKERLWISTLYIGDEQLVDAVGAAARRGVDVRITTTSPDAVGIVPGTSELSHAFYRKLLDDGARIYENPTMHHAKGILSDDKVSLGSMNMSLASALNDFELNVTSELPRLRAQVEQFFEHDFGVMREFERPDLTKRDSWLERIRGTTGVQH